MESKTCSRCQVSKDLALFTKNNKSKDGRGSWCKICANEYRRQNGLNSYALRPEYTANYQRNLRKTDKYKVGNRHYKRKYKCTLAGMATSLLCNARDRAKRGHLEINIDRQWVIEHLLPLRCEATGVELVLERDENVTHTAFRPSIDRIDNRKGYTKDNCRIVSVIYNKAKSDYNDEDVLRMAQALVEWRGR